MLVWSPEPVHDDRGWFVRTFDADVAREHGVRAEDFVQDSVSRSHRGVVRGLHVRTGRGEAKLVRCSRGALFDVVVDLRVGSSTYGEWEGFELTSESAALGLHPRRLRARLPGARRARPTRPTASTAATTRPSR